MIGRNRKMCPIELSISRDDKKIGMGGSKPLMSLCLVVIRIVFVLAH